MTSSKTTENSKDKSSPRSATPSRGSLPSLSAVSTQPLDPEKAKVIFTEVIREALRLKILDVLALIAVIGVKRMLESVATDVKRRAKIVHDTLDTNLKLALAQSEREGSVEKQAADITYMIDELKDDDIATKLLASYGFEKIVELVPLWELYQLLMQSGWIIRDGELERELGFFTCKILLEHRIYDNKTLVYEHIRNAIGNMHLVGDSVPAPKRGQIIDAFQAAMKSKAVNTTLLGEIIFDAVSLEEYAEFLPPFVLAKPFGDYVQLLGVAEAPKPAVPPPLPPKTEAPEEDPLPPLEGGGREPRDSISPEVSISADGDGNVADAEEEIAVDEIESITPRCDKCQVLMQRDGEQYACQGCGDTVPVEAVAMIAGSAE